MEHIVVCIKQVPGTNQVEVDEVTGVLKRDGASAKLNPYDLYALETALRLKEETGAKVSVISMGPPQAETAIRECYMMGVDAGCLLSDRAFAGADVLATSYTLASGIKSLGKVDLILCGKQTTDGDTAQVGPAIAEHLGIPHVTWVKAIQEVTETAITVLHNMEDTTASVRMPFPCLISVEKDIYAPRLPSYLNMKKTADWPVTVLGLKDLPDTDAEHYGLNGSPTQVERVFQPEHHVEQVLWNNSETDCAEALFSLLKTEKYL